MEDFDEQIFERAAQFVERGWCQGVSATTVEGVKVQFEHAEAARFCGMGALARALHEAGWWCAETQSMAFQLAQRKLATVAEGISFTSWNDKLVRTKEEVAAVLRTKVEAK